MTCGRDASEDISADVLSVSFEDHATDADMVTLSLANPETGLFQDRCVTWPRMASRAMPSWAFPPPDKSLVHCTAFWSNTIRAVVGEVHHPLGHYTESRS